jgi:hypothetical protein
VIEPSILLLGLGLGLVMPNMTIAVQNALPAMHRGVGTATLAFFRSLGGLIGVTGSGAIFSRELHLATNHTMKLGAEASSLMEGGVPQMKSLSSAAQVDVIAIYRHAIATTFTAGIVIVSIALIVILFLPELPLRTHGAPDDRPTRAP